MQVKKQQLELDMKQQTGFQIRKGVCQGCILPPCLFNYMQSISCEMPGCFVEGQAGIRLLGEISINSDMQMTPPLWQKVKGTNEPLDENKERVKKLT